MDFLVRIVDGHLEKQPVPDLNGVLRKEFRWPAAGKSNDIAENVFMAFLHFEEILERLLIFNFFVKEKPQILVSKFVELIQPEDLRNMVKREIFFSSSAAADYGRLEDLVIKCAEQLEVVLRSRRFESRNWKTQNTANWRQPTANYQLPLPTTNCRLLLPLPTIDSQLQLPTIDCQLTNQLPTTDSQLQLPTINCQLPNQLPTTNSQLPTTNSQMLKGS